MKKLKIVISTLLVIVAFTSCQKGDTGPTGDKGANGAIGPAGPVGADGKNGSMIYSGNTPPASTQGTIGDFYLNTITGLLYGPKNVNGWGTGFSLKGTNGAAGAAGTDGSNTLSGAGSPTVNVGKNGDYYLDKTNYLLYGPKTNSTWPAPINLRGPKGDPGTANVIYSDWFTIAAGDYTFGTSTTYHTYSYNKAEPKVTTAILDKGVVLVYAKLNMYEYTGAGGLDTPLGLAGKTVQLPYTVIFASQSVEYRDLWSFIVSAGNIKINLVNITGVGDNQFRYVIIPGGISTLGTINIKNYGEVKAALHLKD